MRNVVNEILILYQLMFMMERLFDRAVSVFLEKSNQEMRECQQFTINKNKKDLSYRSA